jgi:hypothetical protein
VTGHGSSRLARGGSPERDAPGVAGRGGEARGHHRSEAHQRASSARIEVADSLLATHIGGLGPSRMTTSGSGVRRRVRHTKERSSRARASFGLDGTQGGGKQRWWERSSALAAGNGDQRSAAMPSANREGESTEEGGE